MRKLETNVEFVERLMEFSPHGALSQVFILTAIEKYADLCAEVRLPEDHGFLDPDAWQNCAKWLQSELKGRSL